MTHDAHDQILFKLGAIAVLAAFAIETGSNAVGGYREAGLGLAALLMAIAVFGALCGVLWRRTAGSSAARRAERAAYLAAGLVCFGVSQIAGNSVFATLLADGGVQREAEATSGAAAREQLQRLRDEQRGLGIQRPSETILAEMELECSIKGKLYKDGVGPKCKGLQAELGKAKRVEQLPQLIRDADARVGKGPQRAAGEGFSGQLKWMLSHTFGEPGDDDLRRGLIAFIVLVLGLVANVGPAMLLGAGAALSGHDGDHAGDGFFADVLGGAPAFAGAAAGPAPRPIPIGGQRRLPAPPRHVQLSRSPEILPPAAGAAGSTSGGATAHGAPVTINMFGPGREGVTDITAEPAPLARRGDAPSMPPRLDVGAVPDQPPADRSSIGAITDSLLAFRAACVVDVSGGHVTEDAMHRRYVAWRGAGALGGAAFHALFGEVCGLARYEIGGQTHYSGVTLRAPALSAVG